ncbi:MAG: putative bifunctional diguanylate cyclase/phosphodiesterase, partial [Deferrisomatales bacterium]
MEDERDPNRPLVLVVDDQAFARRVLRDWLEAAGYAVEEAGDGAEALERFGRIRPDLVLLDVVMPVMDGFTACAELRKMPAGANAPILIMTGLEDEDAIRRAYQAGATDFIHKPINGVVLGYRVRYLLRASRTAEELRRSQAKLTKAQQRAALGYWELEPHSGKLTGSAEFERIVGSRGGTLLDTWEAFLDRVHPEDRTPIDGLIRELLARALTRSADLRLVTGEGLERVVHLEAEVVGADSGEGARVEGTLQDITDLRRAEERIRFLASYDPLTGLPNRAFILDHLNRMVGRAAGDESGVALFLVGVDHFKRINDTLGHRFGDQLLQEIGQRLVGCVAEAERGGSQGDFDRFIGRFSADEFVAFLTGVVRVEEVARLARRLTGVLRRPFFLGCQEVFVTASIGISLHPYDGRDAESLLRNAASAMAHAKTQGLTDYQFYTESMNRAASNHFTLESRLRRAEERGEFTLHYQPQIDLRTGEIVGTEALLRWQSPDLGLVYPLQFLPLAEATGLILPIGDWVFRTACAQAVAWQTPDRPRLRMAVNVSARQFQQKDFVGTVVRALEEAGLDPRHLDAELTESTVMEDVGSAVRSLERLKAMGLQVSVDDFGTGYSSLSYLRRFPLDALKIDYTF